MKYLKKMLALLMAVLMIVSAPVADVFASGATAFNRFCFTAGAVEEAPSFPVTGTCGTNATWTLDADGSLVISGSGNMSNYTYNVASPMTEYKTYIKTIVIEGEVTSVGDFAFSEFDSVTSVTMSDSITKIGMYAFYGCTAIERITFPENLKTIDGRAFCGCISLENVVFGSNLETISANAFYCCESLKSVITPESLKTIDMYAFEWCTALEYFYVPSETATFGISCLYGCPNVIIYCVPGSKAESYAGYNDVGFMYISNSNQPEVILYDGETPIMSGYTVRWYESGVEESVFTGRILAGYDEEKTYYYEVIFSEELSYKYRQPSRQLMVIDNTMKVTYSLEKIEKYILKGNIFDAETESPLNAKIEVSQTFNTYTKTSYVYADSKGEYSIEVLDAPLSITCSYSGYRTQERSLDKISEGSKLNFSLSKLPENKITVSAFVLCAAEDGEQVKRKAVKSFNNYRFSVTDKTTDKVITDFEVSYPDIIIVDEDVKVGDTIEITATDRMGVCLTAVQTCVLDENKCGAISLELTEKGKIAIDKITGAVPAVIMIFNEDGKLVSSAQADYALNDAFCSSALTEGEYSVVVISKNDYLRKTSDIADLDKFQLEKKEDYLLFKVDVEDGKITAVEEADVPYFDVSRFDYLDSSSSYIKAADQQAVAGKYVIVRSSYKVKKGYSSSEETVDITLPDNCIFADGSLTVDGKKVSYTYEDNVLTVPVGKNEAVIRFYIIPTEDGEATITSSLAFNNSGTEISQPIGSTVIKVASSEIYATDKTREKTVYVRGTAIPGSKVIIYDNAVPVAETLTNTAGSWYADIELNNPTDKSVHTICAELESVSFFGNKIYTEPKYILYDPGAVVLSDIDVYVSGQEMSVSLLRRSEKPTSYVLAGAIHQYTFKVNVLCDKPEDVEKVTVITYDKDNDISRIEARYDAGKNAWLATRRFWMSDAPTRVTAIVQEKEYTLPASVVDNDVLNAEVEYEYTYYDGNVLKGIATVDGEEIEVTVEAITENTEDFTYDSYLDEGYEVFCKGEDVTLLYNEETEVGVQIEHIRPVKAEDKEDSDKEGEEEDEEEKEDEVIIITVYVPPKPSVKPPSVNPPADNPPAVTTTTNTTTTNTTTTNRTTTDATTTGGPSTGAPPTSTPPFDNYACWQDYFNNASLPEARNKLRDMIEDAMEKYGPGTPEYYDLQGYLRWMDNNRNIRRYLIAGTGAGLLSPLLPSSKGNAYEQAFSDGWSIGGVLGTALTARDVAKNLGNTERNFIDGALGNLEKNGELPRCEQEIPPNDGGPINPIIDPSGYVYEAVPSNRVEGVKVEAYYYDYPLDEFGMPADEKEEILWDAEDYNQVNPLYTDADGRYAWDVPPGQWLVKYTKDGYYDTDSRNDVAADEDGYLPVPPPQTEVNTAIVSKAAPTVESVNIYNESVQIIFSQYMKPDTVNENTVKVICDGKTVNGTLTASNAEYNYEETEQFASIYTFTPEAEFAGTVSVTVDNAVNYAGKSMAEEFSTSAKAETAPEGIRVPENITVVYDADATVEIAVEPVGAATGKALTVSSLSPNIVGVVNGTVTTDKNGKASIVLHGNLPGSSEIRVALEGTDISAVFSVNVGDVPLEGSKCETVTASIPNGSKVEAGTTLTLSTATEGAEIYYTLDGTCPCVLGSPSRILYEGPITIDKDTFIIAYAVKEGCEDSSTAGFVYTVETECTHKQLKSVSKVPAKCTASGTKAYYECQACGKKFTDSSATKEITDIIIPSTGHKGGKANCKEQAKCSTCGISYGSINKNNHKSVTTLKAISATYKKDGLTAGKKCTACGKVIVAQKAVARKTLAKVNGLETKAVKLASGSKTNLTLTWTKVDGAEKYEVQQYSGGTWKTVGTSATNSFVKKNLKAKKTYKFRVKAIAGEYSGEYSSVYSAKNVPLKTAVTLKSGKKQLTASWNTIANITKYEVQYSTSKSFKKKTTKTTKSRKLTVKKLKKGKKYYVRVRAYKTVNGKKIYGSWSSVKSIKVK